MIAHVFRRGGRRVGLTSTDGIAIGDRLIIPGDSSGPRSARMVLQNPRVDGERFEVAGGGVLRAGDGSERTRLREHAAALGLGGVTFTGPVAPHDMPALYDAADLYVNASLIDNMPLSILEAYAAGTPVVTSDAGGIPVIAHDGRTALVTRGAAPPALAAGILRLLEEPALAADLVRQGRELVLDRYSWAAVGGRWERLYREEAARR
jgi:glycosyltransferase involved in cell wall biosynthesis